MSNLIIDLNDLQRLRQNNNNGNQYLYDDPIRCRVFTQIVELEFLDPRTTSPANFCMCNIKIRNISMFRDLLDYRPQDITLVVKMDENVYDSISKQGNRSIQSGDLCEMNLVTWNPQNHLNSTTELWEVIDMNFLSLTDIEDLHTFLLSKEGKEFLMMSNPAQNVT
ncbi:similar to Kazachstania africana KAFR_0C06340 hypothetical protein [Maudiozyma saulgeensis]|uniref:Uncharacterized protein n=1 Tax=Maudiozyma saulgeensis TaxID=1789683 RepID=A0A1X7QXY5_9SACH|nr:similar to Kazachstania africana KAFR_0C06340 hypothetical protein [Kazachstania saulgeensis]